jgi:hypothetical protein
MGNEAATISSAPAESTMQDIAKRIESNLYPQEPIGNDGDEGLEDDVSLPENTDSESEDDEGSTDKLDEVATEEELSLANYLGVDEDRIIVSDDGSLMFKAIVDGKTKEVPLKELAASYQLQGHVNNKSMALENERKQFQQVQAQVAQELRQRVEGVSQLGNLAEQELIKEYESIDWNTLRYQDPANWTALRQEYAERAQKIQQVKQLTQIEAQRLQKEQAEKFHKQAEEYFAQQMKSMIDDNPTWADEKVRLEKVGEMKSFLKNYGFNERDAMGINDHRLVRLIKDAQAYRSGLKAAEEKRVDTKKLPKFQKPGSSKLQSASLAKARQVKAQKGQLKKTGSVNDLAAALVDRM